MMKCWKSIAAESAVAVVLWHSLIGHAQMASQMLHDKTQAPVAISSLPSGKLVVLGGRGRLSVIDTSNGSVLVLKSTLGYFTPADMAAGQVQGADAIFVALYNAAEHRGVLAEYSLSGEQLKMWLPQATIAGVAVDPVHGLVYLGDPVTGEISLLAPFEKSGSPSYLLEVPGVSRLGPLAIDTARQRLFAADVGSGSVYLIDLASRKSRMLASDMGEPAALAYDTDEQMLYIADAARHKIWRYDASSPTAKVTVFSSAPELREPRGVTVDAQHTVWAADHGAIAVFRLSPKGDVSARFSP